MDRLVWGASQGMTSAFFFLIQLSFLKSADLSVMAEFSILFGLMNFLLLMTRRSLIEINDFALDVPGTLSIIGLLIIFLGVASPISYLMQGTGLILFCVTIFLFNQIALDILRFSSRKNHFHFLTIQTCSMMVSLGAIFIGIDAVQLLLGVTVLQLFFSLVYLKIDKRSKIDFKGTVTLMNFTRLTDFAITSGFGFFLPLLTILLLDSRSVGVLRTSQNFLSLGSIFTVALYHSTLQKGSQKALTKASYYSPTLILLGILFSLEFYLSDQVLIKLFGPYFHDSLTLTCLLLIALVPTMLVTRLNATMIALNEFGGLFRIHCVSLSVLVMGSSLGFVYLGINAFGVFSILCALLEILLVSKFLKAKNG